MSETSQPARHAGPAMPVPIDYRHLGDLMERAALAAGNRIMEIFREGCAVEAKADTSPVTQADRDAEAIILAELREAYPHVPVVAEEEVAAGIGPDSIGDIFFLVDPLDGTKEFVNRRSDFTVNIALVRDGEPVAGVVYAPARHMLYRGVPGHAELLATDASHAPLERRAIAVRAARSPLTIVASRSHCTPETEAYIARFEPAERVSVGSSLKFCLLAAGEADLYPRFGPTMQWDTAAGDAVLRAAGGRTLSVDGGPLAYGAPTAADGRPFVNPSFVAEGRLEGAAG